MPIIYRSGNRSLDVNDLVNAETEEEMVNVALRLFSECYDVHSFSTTRLPAVTIVAHACGQEIDWSDFVSKGDYVEGTINLNGKTIEVYVEKSGGKADVVHVFTTDFRLIGVGSIYAFDLEVCPKFKYRFNGHHHYTETDSDMKRIVSSTADYRLMTQENIDAIKEYWSTSDNLTFGDKAFIMPQFKE